MFKNPFSYNGRIRRLEYGITLIIYFVLYFIVLMLWESTDALVLTGFAIFIPLIWFVTAQAAKRCHDVGRSGWFQLIPLYSIIVLFQEGVPGMNEYGHNPKTHPHLSDANSFDSETLDGHLQNPEKLQ